MSISIHELLAVARESEGVKAVKGDDILCFQKQALVVEGTLHYLPAQTCFYD